MILCSLIKSVDAALLGFCGGDMFAKLMSVLKALYGRMFDTECKVIYC
jgi:hypothetical protein